MEKDSVFISFIWPNLSIQISIGIYWRFVRNDVVVKRKRESQSDIDRKIQREVVDVANKFCSAKVNCKSIEPLFFLS